MERLCELDRAESQSLTSCFPNDLRDSVKVSVFSASSHYMEVCLTCSHRVVLECSLSSAGDDVQDFTTVFFPRSCQRDAGHY
jgi:hypothetical protein